VTPATLRQGFSSLFVLAVLAARDGSIWLRTVDGVNHWRDGHVTVYREFADPSNGTRSPIPPPVKDDAHGNILGSGGGSLFEDERGRVWLSTVRSVGYLDHGRFSAVRGVPGGRVHAGLIAKAMNSILSPSCARRRPAAWSIGRSGSSARAVPLSPCVWSRSRSRRRLRRKHGARHARKRSGAATRYQNKRSTLQTGSS